MISNNESTCPHCGGKLKYYDNVDRIVRTKYGKVTHTKIKRYRCLECNEIHRELPNYILPYKQYEAEIISGVIDGLITVNTIGFEDYPCEMTMKRWILKFST